ncbi:uncharacterized protein LOC141899558 [Tubulanus polymorphus]|uniref:uncharacterized protein LOC141899558 n=1 Tax=Tubulanus polymorphus TaxID=672921 RepID=UPI003DA59575
MDDEKYSNAFNAFNAMVGDKTNLILAEAFRRCYKECRAAEDSRGLRILAIGPARGHLIEDALFTAQSDIRIDQLDCVEPNTHMLIELKERMGLLASKFDFSFTIHNRHFNSEESRSFLPNNFYDLLLFSHVLYYFDDPGFVLETALYQLAHCDGMAFIAYDNNSQAMVLIRDEVANILSKSSVLCDDESRPQSISCTSPLTAPNTAPDTSPDTTTDTSNTTPVMAHETSPHTKIVQYDICGIIKKTKTRIICHESSRTGTAIQLALKPVRPCISEFDKFIRKMSDDMLSFVAQTDITELADDTREYIQNIVRKYTVEHQGINVLGESTETFLIARIKT